MDGVQPVVSDSSHGITSAYMSETKNGQDQSTPSVPKPDVNVQNATTSVPVTYTISQPDTTVKSDTAETLDVDTTVLET